MRNYTIFEMYPRRGRQARHFTTNVPKILDLKSSSEQIFSENWRWVPLSRDVIKHITGRRWLAFRGYTIMLFAILVKTSNVSSHPFNSMNNGDPVLLFKTIFRRWNCFLSRSVAKDHSKDGLRLKLEKTWVLMLCQQKSPKKCYGHGFLTKFL